MVADERKAVKEELSQKESLPKQKSDTKEKGEESPNEEGVLNETDIKLLRLYSRGIYSEKIISLEVI
jgi:hypothetical protein